MFELVQCKSRHVCSLSLGKSPNIENGITSLCMGDSQEENIKYPKHKFKKKTVCIIVNL